MYYPFDSEVKNRKSSWAALIFYGINQFFLNLTI